MANFAERIVALVEENWATKARPLLLSKLGSYLRAEFDVEKETHQTPLLKFIQITLNDKLKIVRNPHNSIVWGLFPKEAEVPNEIEALEKLFIYPRSWVRSAPTSKSAEVSSLGPLPLYDPRLWRAFAVPLEDNRRRVLSVKNGIRFKDLFMDEEIPSDYLEVERNLVVPLMLYMSRDERNQKIAANISAWCGSNGIGVDQFFVNLRDRNSVGPLEQLASVFTQVELARIQIPLDLVCKLLNIRQ